MGKILELRPDESSLDDRWTEAIDALKSGEHSGIVMKTRQDGTVDLACSEDISSTTAIGLLEILKFRLLADTM